MNNPFLHDFPIDTNTLPSRQRILRQVWEAINTNSGQSILIVSETWMKKGKFLSYIPSTIDNYKSKWNLIFSFIDVSTLGDDIAVEDFWRIVSESLIQQIAALNAKESFLEKIVLPEGDFTTIKYQHLFKQFSKNHIRLVLLIDEFNLLTQHPSLKTSEMFGTLRHIATAFDSLVIVGASRYGLLELFNATIRYRTKLVADLW